MSHSSVPQIEGAKGETLSETQDEKEPQRDEERIPIDLEDVEVDVMRLLDELEADMMGREK
jgi:hypothetical protein